MRKSVGWSSVGVVCLLIACTFLPGCQPKQVELIPRETFFGTADKIRPQLSPKGTYLTYVAPYEGAMNVWIRTNGKEDDRPVTNNTGRGVYYYKWDSEERGIIFTEDRNNSDAWHLYFVSIPDGKIRPLTSPHSDHSVPVQVEMLKYSSDKPDEMLIQANLRDPGSHDLYLLNIITGDLELIQKANPIIFEWIIDHDGLVRGYVQAEDDGGQSFWYRDGGSGPFEQEIVWHLIDDSSWPLMFAKDNHHIYLRDSRNRNATALVLYDPDSNTSEVIAEDPEYDFKNYLYDYENKEIIAASFMKGRREWVVLQDEYKQDFDRLKAARDGDVEIVDLTRDLNTWLVAYIMDDGPIEYFRYSRESGELDLMFVHREALQGHTFAEMQPYSIKTRDGYTIHGYITLPTSTSTPAPLVVLGHRLKHVPDRWGFNPEVQWLANRGYVCLQVNTRGTMGFGKEFQNAGNREMGNLILQDINDAVIWAIEQEYADPDNIAIFGGQHGGYDTFAALTFSPELYKAGVAVSGHPDLIEYLNSIPPQWERFRTNFNVRWGKIPRYTEGERTGQLEDSTDWDKDERAEIEFLRSRSPFYHVEQVEDPLLIVHGARDFLVYKALMDEYVERLRNEGVAVKYKVFEDETHGINLPENQLEFYRIAEKFLSDHLGGRFEE